MFEPFILMPETENCGHILAETSAQLLLLTKQLRNDCIPHRLQPKQIEMNGEMQRLPAVRIAADWNRALSSLEKVCARLSVHDVESPTTATTETFDASG